MKIEENLQNINSKIKNTDKKVTILAATKKRTIQEILEAIDAGITDIGENYVKEAEEKYLNLKGYNNNFEFLSKSKFFDEHNHIKGKKGIKGVY